MRTDFWTWTGFAKPTTNETTETYQFGELSIAFEVGLRMAEEPTLSLNDSWRERFKATPLFMSSQSQDRVFRHLFLDFESKS